MYPLPALNYTMDSPQSMDRALSVATSLYLEARSRARTHRLWSRLTGRPRDLETLTGTRAGQSHEGHFVGVRMVPMEQIRGSEGRVQDFDIDFYPTQDHTRGRWIKVAAAAMREVPLPPVDLFQVGTTYYVRDGHHRISVARARGQRYIDARVTRLNSFDEDAPGGTSVRDGERLHAM